MTDEMTQVERAAYSRGRGEGLAIAALAVGGVAFINLLGAEKALLALILAMSALGLRDGSSTKAVAAISLSCLYLVTMAGVLIVYRDKIGPLVRLLKDLG